MADDAPLFIIKLIQCHSMIIFQEVYSVYLFENE